MLHRDVDPPRLGSQMSRELAEGQGADEITHILHDHVANAVPLSVLHYGYGSLRSQSSILVCLHRG